jgi:hypothetical protein
MDAERALGASAGCDESHPAWVRLKTAEQALRNNVDHTFAVLQLDTAIVAAIDRAQEAGVIAGLIVAVLQGHLWQQTGKMLK